MNYKLRSTNCEEGSFKYELRTVNYNVCTLSYELWTMNCELWTTNYELWSMKWELSTVKYEICIENLKPRTLKFWSLNYEFWNVTSRRLIQVLESYELYIEPVRDKTNIKTCSTSEDSDQPAHRRSLIRIFAICALYISRLSKHGKTKTLANFGGWKRLI